MLLAQSSALKEARVWARGAGPCRRSRGAGSGTRRRGGGRVARPHGPHRPAGGPAR